MAVLIDNQHPRLRLDLQLLEDKAQALLNALDCPEGELSVLIVNDEHIAALNEQYLNRRGPTNVIAFPMREGQFGNLHPELLGDVVISLDTCAREGAEAGIPEARRFDELLVHGILHLFGYDHEPSEEQAAAMEAKSRELLELIRDF